MSEGSLTPVRRKDSTGTKKLIGHQWQFTYKGKRTTHFFGRQKSRKGRAQEISDLASQHRRTVDDALAAGPRAEIPTLGEYGPKWLEDRQQEIDHGSDSALEQKTLDAIDRI